MSDSNDNTPVDLAKIEDADIQAMSAKDLAELCEDQPLQKKGNKKTLMERLFLKKHGQSSQYVMLMTKCKICHAKVRVTNTKKKPMGDGRTLVTRTVKCRGKHCHTYALKNIVKPD